MGKTYSPRSKIESLFSSDSNGSVFIESVSFYSVSVENVFTRIKKNDSNSVLNNMLYKYKNTFNINKLLKMTYNCLRGVVFQIFFFFLPIFENHNIIPTCITTIQISYSFLFLSYQMHTEILSIINKIAFALASPLK